MKKIVVGLVLIGLLSHSGYAGKYGTAVTKGGKAKITFRVSDDEQNPVAKVNVQAGFYYNPEKQGIITGETGTNGLCAAEGITCMDMWYSMGKKGYYKTEGRYVFGMVEPPVIKNHWQPWNPTNEVILKPIKNPIPMYAKSINVGVPEYEKFLGFDLEKGDWVAPYGNGVESDFVFYAELDQRGKLDFDYTLTLTFSNEKDGILPVGNLSENASVLQSVYMASEIGYLSSWEQFRTRRPKTAEESNRDKSRIYCFRVRTVLDECGNVVSAQYGKIYGDFLQFTYYLNPTPNDRNVEFDPNKNLFGGRNRFAP